MRYIAGLVGVVVPPGRDREPVPQLAELQETQANGEEDAGSQQRDHDPGDLVLADWNPSVPDVLGQRVYDLLEYLHGAFWRVRGLT